ncbi:MAG: type II secretion system protein [Candidatus Magnetomorum sp.]|nr:type II secretion system protein [Candidatus Magnetomorum sp.]
MKDSNGFTLFEIVITLLVIFIVSAYIIPVLGSSFFNFDRPVKDLQEILKLKMIMENITHDYTNRCFAKSPFNLEELRIRIGRTNAFVNNSGSAPEYHPYGFDGQEYIRYFVKYNEFVTDKNDKDTIHMVRDYSSSAKRNMLLVTIQLERISDKSLTVLFTEKKKQ